MITISLCLIVKNEEDVLARCLDSVRDIADEIVIVDTGSTDRTKEIAGEYTEAIYSFEWIDDFAAARNYAFSLATSEYILWLDADDVFLEADREKLLKLKAELSNAIDTVSMNYHLAKDEYGRVTSSLRRNRLVKRSRGFRWIGAVHEYLEVFGPSLASDIAVTHASLRHDSDRNLRIYENRLAAGENFNARDTFYYANELKDHGKYEQAIAYYTKFLLLGEGWVEDNISACAKLSDCYSALGNDDMMMHHALMSFRYGTPLPEFCCRIGYWHLQQNAYETAAYWYQAALNTPQSAQTWSLRNDQCATWLPHLQLCVCYDRLGDQQRAYMHNEKAREYRPTDASVLYNKQYLESILFPERSEEPSEVQQGDKISI
ncbi:glycosyl transferase family 2 [Paenibacillus cellulosilyticus]|uniref:Glycosyl transferase family 2 n=1 Tax=Paenibacillus cellulosilyticus TaxID=375489 RepID=A0A2V2Z3P0_9BACL|nr:glycosyltransferase family 2 protein [Paenibacillus cellulosilyticus]PWW04843.1 glycosyl transferase family 2 [Paenibacillus cellulosilyticus]QKS45957.1 glycosyltransferase family 2 protein [Paenibacillus cellulosilyticus]